MDIKNRYGVFHITGMNIGVCAQNIQEVVKDEDIQPIPTSYEYIVGAINLRGVVVPVIDLGIYLKKPPFMMLDRSIAILRHNDQIVGLVVDRVIGISDCETSNLKVADGFNLSSGYFMNGDDATAVTIVTFESIARLPGVDTVEAKSGRCIESRGESLYLLLMESGHLSVAVPSSIVHTILIDPRVQDSALRSSVCAGVIEVDGKNVPALEFAQMCGLKGARRTHTQAFVVKYEAGMVAFLIDSIVDVVLTHSKDLISTPARGAGYAPMVKGVIPNNIAKVRDGVDSGYLVIDEDQLLNSSTALTFASLNTLSRDRKNEACQVGSDGTGSTHETIQALVFNLRGEMAVRVSEVSEIIPWNREKELHGASGQARFLVENRGTILPVFCLAECAGVSPGQMTDESRILIINGRHQTMGFLVSSLVSIESVLQSKAERTQGSGYGAVKSSGLVTVKRESGTMMIQLIDIRRICDDIESSEQATDRIAA